VLNLLENLGSGLIQGLVAEYLSTILCGECRMIEDILPSHTLVLINDEASFNEILVLLRDIPITFVGELKGHALDVTEV
jgi:hypothetical protein